MENKLCEAARKYRINSNNALCKRSVEFCGYCDHIFFNKLDALVHNAKHAVVQLNPEFVYSRIKEMQERERLKAALQILKLRNYNLDLQRDADVCSNSLETLELVARTAKNDRKKRRKEHRRESNDSNTKDALSKKNKYKSKLNGEENERLTQHRPDSSMNGEPSNKEEDSPPNNLLQNFVADCKVNLEPMICDDTDSQNFLKNAVKPKPLAKLLPPSFTRGSVNRAQETNVPNILSSFTNECRVVLDNPLSDAPLTKTNVLNLEDDVKPTEMLDSFTAECKVILGSQTIFNDEPAEQAVTASPNDVPRPAIEGLNDAEPELVEETDKDEPPVNVLNLHDYDSLIKPLICYCPLCPEVFPNRFELYQHKTSHLRISFRHSMFFQLRVRSEPSRAKAIDVEGTAGRVETPRGYGMHCAACHLVFQCLKDLVRHAAKHVNEALTAEERSFLPSSSRVYKECEACYKAEKSPRRLIGHINFAEVCQIRCVVCQNLRARFKLYWRPREVGIKPVVIDLCEDEPEAEALNISDFEDDSGYMRVGGLIPSPVAVQDPGDLDAQRTNSSGKLIPRDSDAQPTNSSGKRINAILYPRDFDAQVTNSSGKRGNAIQYPADSNAQQSYSSWDHGNSNAGYLTNADSEMATLVLNPAPNNDYDADILDSIFGPSETGTESTFILGQTSSTTPGQAGSKKDYINTVWEDAFSNFIAENTTGPSAKANPNPGNAHLNWGQTTAEINDSVRGIVKSQPKLGESKSAQVNSSAEMNNPVRGKKTKLGESKSDQVNSNAEMNNSVSGKVKSKPKLNESKSDQVDSERTDFVQRTIKERITFEDEDYVPNVSKHKSVCLVQAKRPYITKGKRTVTNAERLANIHRKLKSLKPAEMKFSNNFHRKFV